MFSVTETKLMFASRSVAWMIASSRRLRAGRSTLLMSNCSGGGWGPGLSVEQVDEDLVGVAG
ncbi:hypothetical protein, partial [Propionibacterium freudenreichii]